MDSTNHNSQPIQDTPRILHKLKPIKMSRHVYTTSKKYLIEIEKKTNVFNKTQCTFFHISTRKATSHISDTKLCAIKEHVLKDYTGITSITITLQSKPQPPPNSPPEKHTPVGIEQHKDTEEQTKKRLKNKQKDTEEQTK